MVGAIAAGPIYVQNKRIDDRETVKLQEIRLNGSGFPTYLPKSSA